MKILLLRYMLLVTALLPIAACDTALSVGSRTIGIRSGEFIYTDGYLRTTYAFPMEKVWAACDKTLTDLKATDVDREKSIATGKFTAFILDDKVRISVELRGTGYNGRFDHGGAVGQQPGIEAHPRPDREPAHETMIRTKRPGSLSLNGGTGGGL